MDVWCSVYDHPRLAEVTSQAHVYRVASNILEEETRVYLSGFLLTVELSWKYRLVLVTKDTGSEYSPCMANKTTRSVAIVIKVKGATFRRIIVVRVEMRGDRRHGNSKLEWC